MKKHQYFLWFSIMLMIGLYSCNSGKKDVIWNGKDFTGWQFYLPDSTLTPEDMWSITDGVIHCTGKVNAYMRTNRQYSDYRLTVEWRWPEKEGNSGVFVNAQLPDKLWPNCMECQLQSGHAGDVILVGPGSLQRSDSTFFCDSTFTFIPKLAASSEHNPGEWNRYTILCSQDKISVSVNGVLQNEGTNPGLTSGFICLQSEGTPIEFRNIKLEKLNQ